MRDTHDLDETFGMPAVPANAGGQVRSGAKAACATTPGVTASHDWEEVGHDTYVCRSCFARSSSRT